MSDWIYLSHVFGPQTPTYGNRGGLVIEPASELCHGATANALRLTLTTHMGTHLDAPKHFFDDGAGIDSYPAEFWRFENPVVVDCPQEKDTHFNAAALAKALSALGITPGDAPSCLFVRTGFERFRGEPAYWERNPGVHPDVGGWLRSEWPTIRLLGMDVISTNAFQHRDLGREAHRALLDPALAGTPIVLLEDMSLRAAKKLKEVFVLPLRVEHGDGAPCTVIGRLA